MTTVLQYLLIAAVVAIVLFGIALLVFGRGEQLAPLPARTSPVSLPKQDISGTDVREVKFALALRGYRMSDVDWTLERLAEELDRAHSRLAELDPAAGTDPSDDPGQPDLFDGEPMPPDASDAVTDATDIDAAVTDSADADAAVSIAADADAAVSIAADTDKAAATVVGDRDETVGDQTVEGTGPRP